MDAETQKKLVKSLCDNLASFVIGQIENGKIPENWDGIELREYWLLSKLFELIKDNFPDDGKNNYHAEWDTNGDKITFSYLGYRYSLTLKKE